MQLHIYKTPGEYLNAAQTYLEERELDNNLILGLCKNFPDPDKEYEGCTFLTVVDDGKIQVTSIKTIAKAILAGTSKNENHLQPIADYYSANNIALSGAWGESFYTEAFLKFYNKDKAASRVLLVHELTSLQELTVANGKFELAKQNNLALISDWTLAFQEETATFPKKNLGEIKASTQNLINKQALFAWYANDEIVCIAAIVRKTKNYGILGLVYTPPQNRGKGYGTSLVYHLSKHILSEGVSKCGLFTDQSNATSNKIYYNIGYRPSTEFSDVEFE